MACYSINAMTDQHFTAQRVDVTVRDRVTFGRDYAVIFRGALARLISTLTRRQLRVFAYLFEQCTFGNDVIVGQDKIAEQTGISRNHVSECITAIENAGFIRTIERGHYRMCEDVMWRGSARDYQARQRELQRQDSDRAT